MWDDNALTQAGRHRKPSVTHCWQWVMAWKHVTRSDCEGVSSMLYGWAWWCIYGMTVKRLEMVVSSMRKMQDTSCEAGHSLHCAGGQNDTDWWRWMESDMFRHLIDNTVKHLFSVYVVGGYLGFRLIHFLLEDVF